MTMRIRFWGVRGSIASPGAKTARVGGNTSSLEIRCGEEVLLLDAGTGIRALGDNLLRERASKAHLLFSHLHWDHIQGLPFFAPAWIPGFALEIIGAPSTSTPELSLRDALSIQMQPPHFPVRLEDMGASIRYRAIATEDRIEIGEATILAKRLNHPGGVLGYRIDYRGKSIVYATDTEHYPAEHGLDMDLVSLAKGADILVYDAMYTEAEYRPSKVGWGHSTWEAGCAVADAADVQQLVLFHHDPQRIDDDVDAIERRAAQRRPGTIAAREGLVLELDVAETEPPSKRPKRAA